MLSEETPIITIINNKRKNEGKTSKVWPVDKTLVGTEESAEAVIRRSSVNKIFLKNRGKFTGKYLCRGLFLMKFQWSLFRGVICTCERRYCKINYKYDRYKHTSCYKNISCWFIYSFIFFIFSSLWWFKIWCFSSI